MAHALALQRRRHRGHDLRPALDGEQPAGVAVEHEDQRFARRDLARQGGFELRRRFRAEVVRRGLHVASRQDRLAAVPDNERIAGEQQLRSR